MNGKKNAQNQQQQWKQHYSNPSTINYNMPKAMDSKRVIRTEAIIIGINNAKIYNSK